MHKHAQTNLKTPVYDSRLEDGSTEKFRTELSQQSCSVFCWTCIHTDYKSLYLSHTAGLYHTIKSGVDWEEQQIQLQATPTFHLPLSIKCWCWWLNNFTTFCVRFLCLGQQYLYFFWLWKMPQILPNPGTRNKFVLLLESE